jgi:hypothetical protein
MRFSVTNAAVVALAFSQQTSAINILLGNGQLAPNHRYPASFQSQANF